MNNVAPEQSGLEEVVERLRIHNAQLERALESRVVIEQAKGVLAERYGITLTAAFELLRGASRSNRTRIHDLARRVVSEVHSPAEIELERASASRRP